MKTSERILLTSLELFNTEGEANVSTVDIANEMDISPGNLYYHYKGKQEIIRELFNRMESELTDILEAPLKKSIKTEDAWIYLYVVFEQIYNHRYFYRSINDLLQRYPDIDRRFRKLVALKVKTAETVARELVEHKVLKIDAQQVSWLANNVAMQLTFWLNFDNLLSKNTPDALALHQGVFQIVSLAAPYLSTQHRYVYDECSTHYAHLVADIGLVKK